MPATSEESDPGIDISGIRPFYGNAITGYGSCNIKIGEVQVIRIIIRKRFCPFYPSGNADNIRGLML